MKTKKNKSQDIIIEEINAFTKLLTRLASNRNYCFDKEMAKYEKKIKDLKRLSKK